MKKKIILTETQLDNLISKVVDNIVDKFNIKDLKDTDDVKSLIDKVKTDTEDDEDKDELDIEKESSTDDEIYKKILTKIGAPHSEENMKFVYAWRQAEGAQAKYNPFNTTHKKDGSTLYNCLRKKNNKCVGGVRNYQTEADGIDATVRTLENGHYPCIVDGLRDDIGAKQIAKKCRSNLKIWGTGDLVAKVLNGKKLSPKKIARAEAKRVG
jgi:hypothetical protein